MLCCSFITPQIGRLDKVTSVLVFRCVSRQNEFQEEHPNRRTSRVDSTASIRINILYESGYVSFSLLLYL